MTSLRFACVTSIAGFAALCQPQATRQESLADFKLERTLALKGDTHHVQGIDLDGDNLWGTSVDRSHQKGYLQQFSLSTAELIRAKEVGAGLQFHPGGMSA